MTRKTFLDEEGFIFLGNDGRPYRCCMWGNAPWLFWWHPENRWVSMCRVSQMDIFTMPDNLTDEQQDHYRRLHNKWTDELRPHFKDEE